MKKTVTLLFVLLSVSAISQKQKAAVNPNKTSDAIGRQASI